MVKPFKKKVETPAGRHRILDRWIQIGDVAIAFKGCGHTNEEHMELIRDPEKWITLQRGFCWVRETDGALYESRHCGDQPKTSTSTPTSTISRLIWKPKKGDIVMTPDEQNRMRLICDALIKHLHRTIAGCSENDLFALAQEYGKQPITRKQFANLIHALERAGLIRRMPGDWIVALGKPSGK